jgi:hypothetical protein
VHLTFGASEGLFLCIFLRLLCELCPRACRVLQNSLHWSGENAFRRRPSLCCVRAALCGSGHGSGSINPAQGQYICDTFVLLDLILKCVRRIPRPLLPAYFVRCRRPHNGVLFRRSPSVYSVAVPGRASQAPDPSLRVRPFVPPSSCSKPLLAPSYLSAKGAMFVVAASSHRHPGSARRPPPLCIADPIRFWAHRVCPMPPPRPHVSSVWCCPKPATRRSLVP